VVPELFALVACTKRLVPNSGTGSVCISAHKIVPAVRKSFGGKILEVIRAGAESELLNVVWRHGERRAYVRKRISRNSCEGSSINPLFLPFTAKMLMALSIIAQSEETGGSRPALSKQLYTPVNHRQKGKPHRRRARTGLATHALRAGGSDKRSKCKKTAESVHDDRI
jgi:hypothetical protein